MGTKAKDPTQMEFDFTPAEEATFEDGPTPGTWAHTARMMAMADGTFGTEEGAFWDSWKDEMKERDF